MKTLAGFDKGFESFEGVDKVIFENYGTLEPKARTLSRWKPEVQLESGISSRMGICGASAGISLGTVVDK